MSGHHPTRAPSFAGVWSHCPGAGRMCTEVESMRTPNERTERGMLSHEYAHALLTGGTEPETDDAEVIEGARMFADTVESRIIALKTGGYEVLRTGSETRLESRSLDNFGSVDFYIESVSPEGALTFDILDYKFGHKYVEVEENRQLACYAVALLEHVRKSPPIEVHFTIVQPFSYGARRVRTAVLDGRDFDRLLFVPLTEAARRVEEQPDTLVAGPHCASCHACYKCPAALDHQAKILEMTEVIGEPVDLSGAQVARLYDVVESTEGAIKALKESLENQIDYLMREGLPVPGWMLGESTSAPAWTDKGQAKTLFKQFGVDPTSRVKTPKQLAQEAGVELAALAPFTETNTTRAPARGENPVLKLLTESN